jgi:hypothetical protein
MQKIYHLRKAIILNAAKEKFDAVALPTNTAEIKRHRHQFREFDFLQSIKDGFTVYKICREGEENILQGLVAVKPSTGFLECANMEVNDFNKSPISMYNGVGKCMIALCCRISADSGLGGYIAFVAKNHLVPYYTRYGAKNLYGLRMFIDDDNAKKLIDLYF